MWSGPSKSGLSRKKFEDFRQTEAGDFSIKFFRYGSTTSQRAEAEQAGYWAISEELNREVTRFSLLQIVELQLWRLNPDVDGPGHICRMEVQLFIASSDFLTLRSWSVRKLCGTIIIIIVIWTIEIRRMSQKFEDLKQTEAGDFSIKFFSYRSTTSQRGFHAGWLLSENWRT